MMIPHHPSKKSFLCTKESAGNNHSNCTQYPLITMIVRHLRRIQQVRRKENKQRIIIIFNFNYVLMGPLSVYLTIEGYFVFFNNDIVF